MPSENSLFKLKRIIRESAFHRSPSYSVNIGFKDLFTARGSLLSYNNHVLDMHTANPLSPTEIIESMTPTFQRDNDKWTRAMQICFVENLLCGCQSKVQLYSVRGNGSELDECFVLDGLQRLTAIASFQRGDFPIFKDIYYQELVEQKGVFPRLRFTVDIFTFDSDIQACEFYIQMNRGITHNERDLESAYEFIAQASEQ